MAKPQGGGGEVCGKLLKICLEKHTNFDLFSSPWQAFNYFGRQV